MRIADCGIRNFAKCGMRSVEWGTNNAKKPFSLFMNSEFPIPKSEIILFFFFKKFVVDGIDEGLPAGFYDIFGDSNGSPF